MHVLEAERVTSTLHTSSQKVIYLTAALDKDWVISFG